MTQIGRGLRELGIGWIPAYSPQAKGRVERSFGTDQDRLVKQLRLAKVKTMQDANQFLEKEYWPEWNERFARPLAGVTDVHRPLTPQIDLAASLSHVEQRVIGNDYTFWFAGRRALVLEILFKLTDLASAADDLLDKLLCDWIGYCESIGGLK